MAADGALKASVLHLGVDITRPDDDALDGDQTVDVLGVEVPHPCLLPEVNNSDLNLVGLVPLEHIAEHIINNAIEELNDLRGVQHELLV